MEPAMETQEVKHEPKVMQQVETAETDSRGSNENMAKQEVPNEAVNQVNFRFVMIMAGMSLTFAVAEITPLFMTTSFTIVAADLNCLDKTIWILIAPFIATGVIAPFVGQLSDLIGRRAIILTSLVVTILSDILQGAAPNFGCFLIGTLLAGFAIGVQLLVVIAAAAELVPVSRRGATAGLLVAGLLPFAPAAFYGQKISAHSWRWNYLLLALIALLAFVILAVFYHPPKATYAAEHSKVQILKRIDYGGCFISTAGLVLFLIGINWGGQDYEWNSPQVISFVTLGLAVLIFFVVYEKWIVKEPMFPARIITNKRHFFAICVLCLTSGVNFVPLTVFWTIQVYTEYSADFDQAGIYLIPLGFCIVGGACISALLISAFKKRIMWILLLFCIMQTVGMASMAAVSQTNINTAWGPMVIGLLGVGGVLLPSQIVFSLIAPDDLIATSIALSVVVRMVGQVVGKSMFFNILKTQVINNAFDVIAVPAVLAGFRSVDRVITLVVQMTAGPLQYYIDKGLFPEIIQEQVPQLIAAGSKLYGKSFPIIYLVSIPWGVLACFACLFLYGIEQHIDDHTAVLLA